jgi:hypothetical protein
VGAILGRQTVKALVLCLLMPVVFRLQGIVSNLINPEAAALHPNYSRNFHLLTDLKQLIFFGSLAIVLALFVAVCTLVIRQKKRSLVWLLLAVLGPFGFAILAMLDDRSPAAETDSYERFVRKLNWFVRAGYEVCAFVILWQAAYAIMVAKRMVMIAYEAATTGVSTAQIMDIRDASSGMWAFGEGNEVVYFVILLYLLRPIVFRIGAQVVASMRSTQAS